MRGIHFEFFPPISLMLLHFVCMCVWFFFLLRHYAIFDCIRATLMTMHLYQSSLGQINKMYIYTGWGYVWILMRFSDFVDLFVEWTREWLNINLFAQQKQQNCFVCWYEMNVGDHEIGGQPYTKLVREMRKTNNFQFVIFVFEFVCVFFSIFQIGMGLYFS